MKKIITTILIFTMIIQLTQFSVFAKNTGNNFELIQSAELSDFGGMAYYYEHTKTGAKVIYVDNGSETKEFSICFKTPPSDSKGANHVLEHALLCGSEKYPTKNIMHYITAGSYFGSMINAKTLDDYTYYLVKTENETEYYNIMDIYLDGVFHPLFLTDENIFKQQGIRLEYINGKVQYNGVVYNELKLKSLDTLENSLSFLSDKLYTNLYGQTQPSFSAGGTIEEIKNLTYDDLIGVYKKYYTPSNSITYLSGKQDIDKTLNALDNAFKEFNKQNISINFEDTKILPSKKVYEYNIDEETKTVDIGFMSSGIMMNESDYTRYARAILFEIIFGKLGEMYPNHYTTGGSGGGIDNSAIIISGIPKEQRNDAIESYNNILKDFSENGIDENLLKNAIDSHFEYRLDSYYYARESYIFDGVIYSDNPFAFAGIFDAKAILKNNMQIFNEVLDKYFINNPYSIAVVSGNNQTYEEPLAFTDADIEKIKADTESFGEWADEPDSKSIIEKIPLLGIEEVYNAPHYYTPLFENENGIDFYFTKKENTDSVSIALYFPINADSSDLQYIQLLVSFLQDNLSENGVIIDLYAGENPNNNLEVNPQLVFFIYGDEQEITGAIEQMVSILKSEDTFNENELKNYITSAPQNILRNGYSDPYYLSYELKQTTLSAACGFYSLSRGAIGQGAVGFYHFLKNIDTNNLDAISQKLSDITEKYITGSIPTAEYIGSFGYDSFKSKIISLFGGSKKLNDTVFNSGINYNSAAVITKLADSTHFMLAGNFNEAGYKYSGKMDVLARVLSLKYLEPVMRGKHGAYGTGMLIDASGVTVSAAGISDIDLTLRLWRGMGDYLRNLDMTQNELNSLIVPTVKEYDEYYNYSENGGVMAITNRSVSDIKRIRDEMLDTKVSDLIGYADFIDKIVAQNHIFAVMGIEAANECEFDFEYFANADTLEIIPQLTKNPKQFIFGKTESTFAPDDYITRAEMAEIISRVTADNQLSPTENKFCDISNKDWFYNSVNALASKGIISGYADNRFCPNEYITRAEACAIFSKYLFTEESTLKNPYLDVSKDDWFFEAVLKMTEKGFLTGYEDNTFKPNNHITRAEAVTIINRMLNLEKISNGRISFDDVSAQHPAYDEIMTAVNLEQQK